MPIYAPRPFFGFLRKMFPREENRRFQPISPEAANESCTETANTFVWAKDCLCKELIRTVGQKYTTGMHIDRVMDFASGTNEEIVSLFPNASEYIFLDSHFLPPPRPNFRLIKSAAGDPVPLDDGSLDIVTTNGSFDHFKQADRIAAFLEIERILRPGGRLLFACEYYDFDPKHEKEFFLKTKADPDIVARNCGGYENINLSQILARLTSLRPCQNDLTILPDGKPLRNLASPDEAKYYRGASAYGLEVTWGAFFLLFEKQ